MEDGEVQDSEYVSGFYAHQTPAPLDALCLLNGYAPPRRGGDFAWDHDRFPGKVTPALRRFSRFQAADASARPLPDVRRRLGCR